MLECGPPTEHRSGAEMKLLPDGTYHLACGSSEMGNGITTAHKQMAAADRRRARRATSTSSMPTPTARPTTPAPSPAPARWWPARRCTSPPRRCATTSSTSPRRHTGVGRDQCRLDNDAVVCGNRRILLDRAACRRRQGRPSLHGRPQGLPVAAHHRLQRAGRAARGASRDRRDPHPAQRACRRHRPADQSRCSAAASSTAPSPWAMAGR